MSVSAFYRYRRRYETEGLTCRPGSSVYDQSYCGSRLTARGQSARVAEERRRATGPPQALAVGGRAPRAAGPHWNAGARSR